MGRSTLVLNMLTRAAITGEVAACLFTFDTTELEVLLRVVSSETPINHADLRSARMTDADWQGLAKDMIRICDAPLYVNSGAAPHLEGLCAAISAATAQHALDLVAIDPLSAVFARSFADNREREVAEVVRRLKALAMQLRIPIIATAELGRQADYPTWRPGLGDLRDTDVIAQVADIIILLHPPDATNQSGPRAREAALTVVKNRYGRRTTITLEKRLNVARFHTPARPHPDEEEK
jgi:replicative DNA helicase